MASLETIGPLMAGMKARADMAGLACEALNRMFQKEQTELVAQVNGQVCLIISCVYSGHNNSSSNDLIGFES